jgi:hypothetical protein
MHKQQPRRATCERDPSEDDIEPTIEIVQLALVETSHNRAGYDPYNTRALTPASRMPPKVDVWQSKPKRG